MKDVLVDIHDRDIVDRVVLDLNVILGPKKFNDSGRSDHYY